MFTSFYPFNDLHQPFLACVGFPLFQAGWELLDGGWADHPAPRYAIASVACLMYIMICRKARQRPQYLKLMTVGILSGGTQMCMVGIQYTEKPSYSALLGDCLLFLVHVTPLWETETGIGTGTFELLDALPCCHPALTCTSGAYLL